MYTLITHTKNKGGKYMSYLENLETVRKKDLLLPDESKEYLHDVYNICDKYIKKNHDHDLWHYYLRYIDDNIGEISAMLEIQTLCLPLYDHVLKEKILNGTDIGGLYKFAYNTNRWNYMTLEERNRYMKFIDPVKEERADIINNFIDRNPYQSILAPYDYVELMQVFLSIVQNDTKSLIAIDILTGGQFAKTVEAIYLYVSSIHDLFRYLKVYQISKDSMKEIKSKIYPLCDAYRDMVVDKAAHMLAIIGRHADVDAIPGNITETQLEEYISSLKLIKTYTDFDGRTTEVDEFYDSLYVYNMFCVRTGNIPPSFEDTDDQLRKKFKRVLNLVRKEIRKYDLKIYKSIYELMFEMADTSINNCSKMPGAKYYTIDDNKYKAYPCSLERYYLPEFKLHVHYVPISKDTNRSKSVIKRMNEYRDRRAFNPLTPNFVEGFADIPSNYIPMDMKEICVDGVDYKFTNDDIVDRDITPVGFSYSNPRSVRSNDFEMTSGMQSISYYPKDEFGEPDRSTWEPRRNNWNQ